MPPLEIIADAITNATAPNIVDGVEGLIARGALAAGTRLPTVRMLARRLEVSPTTVAAAWQQLVANGVIATKGRAGSFVVELAAPRRRSWLAGQPGRYRLDLSTGTPDPSLLPDIPAAMAKVTLDPPRPSSYLGPVVLPALEAAIRSQLHFDPQSITVVNGAIDALDRVMAQVVRRGAAVIVEDPCFPPIAELVTEHGGRLVPVPLDGEGLRIDALVDAADNEPSVMVFQPRANNPAGVSTSMARMAELAEFLDHHPTLFVIEDDSAGDIAFESAVSLASRHPDRVAHIRSYSKSHGPDLRLASLSGPSRVIDAVIERRRLGPVWTSRILQHVLLVMLTDPGVQAVVEAARTEYRLRRTTLIDALASLGVIVGGNDGINLWVPVTDERDALIALASYGVGVAPGSPFQLHPGSPPHVRITISTVPGSWEELAGFIADAASGTGKEMRWPV